MLIFIIWASSESCVNPHFLYHIQITNGSFFKKSALILCLNKYIT